MNAPDVDHIFKSGIMSGPLAQHKLHFIHIPKNAGTTVMKDFLNYHGGAASHATANQVKNLDYMKGWNNFIVCRDPFERFVSVYLWRLRKDELIQRLTLPASSYTNKKGYPGILLKNWHHDLGYQGEGIRLEPVIELLQDEHVRAPLHPWGWENDEDKLDRMFNRQVTWMNERTVYIARCEQINENICDLIRQYKINELMPFQNKGHNKAKSYGPQTGPVREMLIRTLNQNSRLKEQFFSYYAADYQKFGYNISKGIK